MFAFKRTSLKVATAKSVQTLSADEIRNVSGGSLNFSITASSLDVMKVIGNSTWNIQKNQAK
jgi:hypothetical protein